MRLPLHRPTKWPTSVPPSARSLSSSAALESCVARVLEPWVDRVSRSGGVKAYSCEPPPETPFQLKLTNLRNLRGCRRNSIFYGTHELGAQVLQSSRRKTRATRLRLNISHMVENTDCATIESEPVCICFHILYFYQACLMPCQRASSLSLTLWSSILSCGIAPTL